MKQKAVTFTVGFLIYGVLFGSMMYYTDTERNIQGVLKSAVFFGIFMALFEVFISPKLKNLFISKQKNKE